MHTVKTDLASFTGNGWGRVLVAGLDLKPGDLLYLTDDEADTVEAVVVKIDGDVAEVVVDWDTATPST